MTVPVTDPAALSAKEFAVLEAEVGGSGSLERLLAWGRSSRPAREIDEILIAVWPRKPSRREAMDARLNRGLKPGVVFEGSVSHPGPTK